MTKKQIQKVEQFKEEYKDIKPSKKLKELIVRGTGEEEYEANKQDLLSMIIGIAFNVYDVDDYLNEDSFYEDKEFIKELGEVTK